MTPTPQTLAIAERALASPDWRKEGWKLTQVPYIWQLHVCPELDHPWGVVGSGRRLLIGPVANHVIGGGGTIALLTYLDGRHSEPKRGLQNLGEQLDAMIDYGHVLLLNDEHDGRLRRQQRLRELGLLGPDNEWA